MQSWLLLIITFVLVISIWILVKKLKRVIIFELDQNSKHFGGELVADVLKAHGVQFLFTLCGGHISPILVAAERQNIRVIDVRHEASAVFAADAVSRLSGTVGVAAVTAGPGLTNTVTAVKNAQMAESPVVLLAGAAAGLLRGRGSLQDIDQLSLFRPLCKWSGRVNCVKDIVPMLCKAFYLARSGTPGPVLVEFPIDTLYPYSLVRQHLRISDNPQSWRQRFTNWYLRFYLFRLFANGFRIPPCVPGQAPTQIPVEIPSIPWPSSKSIDQLVWLLSQAKRPVIVVSSQALLPPVPAVQTAEHVKMEAPAGAVNDNTLYLVDTGGLYTPNGLPIGSLEERSACRAQANQAHGWCPCTASLDPLQPPEFFPLSLRIPVYLTGMARGLLGRHHPCVFRHARRAALRVADLIILAGTVCDFRMDYGRVLNRKAKIVVINRDKKQLYLNSDIFWRPYLAIRGDVGTALKELSTSLNDRFPCMADFRCPTDWVGELLAREHHRDEEIRQSSQAQPSERINPLTVLWQLEHNGLTDQESIIVADGGDFVGSAAYILRPRGPLSWLDPGPFGTLGVGGGFALGAKLCRPEAHVWVVYGDGSSGYSLAEWDTMARHKAPAIGVIGNDACWSQIARDQLGLFGSNVACGLRSIRYDLVGAAYAGADPLKSSAAESGAFLVNEKNLNDLSEIMAKARELSDRGLPSVINCNIAASGFREGSISL